MLCISIHALLAESDLCPTHGAAGNVHFYPRSPCGERLIDLVGSPIAKEFLSTLSLRRATLMWPWSPLNNDLFLSTLSLRRATTSSGRQGVSQRYFYPRSPCGERPYGRINDISRLMISIHALLAESDFIKGSPYLQIGISIHALLAESD